MKTDLRVQIGNLQMKNPVMPASGTYDYFEDNANVFPLDELGAIMLKSIHRRARPGNKPPRIVEVTAGMLNAVGIPSIGIEAFVATHAIEKYAKIGAPVVISVSGNSPQDYVECAQMLEDCTQAAALELNLSCPNVGTGLQLSSDETLLRDTVSGVRAVSHHTIIAKLSPNVTDIRKMARISQDCGADAVTIANTFMAMKIDIKSRKPFLGNIQGGFSGPAIKPIVMRMVYQVFDAVQIPILACGGITCAADAIEFVLAGATAVQVGAANFVDPLVMLKVIQGMEEYMTENHIASLSVIRGAAHC